MDATYLGDIELTDETLEHYGVKGMKWKKGTKGKKVGDKYYYYQPKANPNNSAAYNQLAGMESSAYQKLLGKIKLTKGGKGKSASSKAKGTGKKASAEKKSSTGKASAGKSSPGSSNSSTPVETKKNSKWKEEEVKVEIKQPQDILDRIRKNYKAKKTRVRT